MLLPRKTICPEVTGTSRMTACAVVDFPEPLSPTMPKVVPRLTRKLDAVDRMHERRALEQSLPARLEMNDEIVDVEENIGSLVRLGRLCQRHAAISDFRQQETAWPCPIGSSAGCGRDLQRSVARLHRARNAQSAPRAPSGGTMPAISSRSDQTSGGRRPSIRCGTQASSPLYRDGGDARPRWRMCPLRCSGQHRAPARRWRARRPRRDRG